MIKKCCKLFVKGQHFVSLFHILQTQRPGRLSLQYDLVQLQYAVSHHPKLSGFAFWSKQWWCKPSFVSNSFLLTDRVLKHIVISMCQWELNRIRILECCTYVLLKSPHTEIQISRYKGEEKKQICYLWEVKSRENQVIYCSSLGRASLGKIRGYNSDFLNVV